MPKFNIENLYPNAEYLFKVSQFLYNEEVSSDIKIITPKFATRMDKVNLYYKTMQPTNQKEVNVATASYLITKFVVQSKVGNKSTVRFFINNPSNDYSNLIKNDKIIFTTNAASALANFNTSSAVILSTSFGTPQKYVDISNLVSSSFTPSSSGNAGSTQTYPSPYTNYFQEFSSKDIVIENFIVYVEGRNNFLRNELIYTSTIRDIIVFAYASAQSPATVDVNKKTLINTTIALDSKTPPSYSSVSIYDKQFQALHSQKRIDKPIVKFWAAIARYKKDSSGNWNGTWLQKDENQNAIWTQFAREDQ